MTKRDTIDIKPCIHPYELSRYWLAVIAMLLALTFVVYLVIQTEGVLAVAIIIVLLQIWIILRIIRAYQIGNMAKVSAENFPKVHTLIQEISQQLDYSKQVNVFVYQDGNVNAFVRNLMGYREVLLPHALLDDMLEQQNDSQLRWIIGRSIGHLKAKHFRFIVLNILIASIEQLFILNLLLNPWERAIHYTADRIGLVVSKDLRAAVTVINKLMLGNDLSEKVTLIGTLMQRQAVTGNFWGWLAIAFSPYPHLTKRVGSLINWCRVYDHNAYDKFIKAESNREKIEVLVGLSDE